VHIGLMVEGQNGLTWERWIHILKTAERLGLKVPIHRFSSVEPVNGSDEYLSYLATELAPRVAA
jgi:hypothetical protein